jgi:hypothetical protein
MSSKSDQLAVERAAWAVALKPEFNQAGLAYREHFNDYQTIFVVTHPDAAGWKVKVTLCSAHGQRNRMEVEGQLIGQSCKPSTRHKVIALLQMLLRKYIRDVTSVNKKEDSARKWVERQRAEVGSLPDLPGIDPEIIKGGPHEGCYCVNFQPGHPLEHLTFAEFKAFHAFVKKLGS